MNTSRNLWPHFIIATFILFVGGMATLVVLACSSPVDLVSADYYDKEIRYQDQIDRLTRAQQLSPQPTTTYDAADHTIRIALPAAHVIAALKGSIQLYRPSRSGLDQQLDLLPDAAGVQIVDASGLAPGLWKINVSWSVAGEEYGIQQDIVIKAGKI